MRSAISKEVDVDLTVADLAALFTTLTDDEQAQFFIEAARIMATWDRPSSNQTFAIGRHLATCECSTEEARDMIREIASAMDSR